MKEMQKQPTMMTIREIAGTGLMSEHALRIMLKAGKLPAIFIGKKALINYDKLCEELQALIILFKMKGGVYFAQVETNEDLALLELY